MKRSIFYITLFLIFAMLFTGCQTQKSGQQNTTTPPANAGGQENVGTNEGIEAMKWIISVGDTEDYYMAQFMKKWMDKITEKSKGAITGEIHYGGQIGYSSDAYEALDMGNMHIYFDGVSAGSEVSDVYNILGLPYLYEGKEHQNKFWTNHFKEATDYMAEESGYRVVGVVDGLNRETTMNIPINSMDDFKNIKIRVSAMESFIKMWGAFGAKPIPIGFYETFTAIQTGVVQGQENDIALSKSAGFFEVAPYLIMTDHNSYEGGIFMSETYYQALSDSVKAIMQEASDEIYKESKEYCITLGEETLEELKAAGVTVMYPDQAPFKEASKVLYESKLINNYKYLMDLIESAK